jgi:hypothetical protein
VAIAFDQQLGNNHSNPAATTIALTTANTVASGGFIVMQVDWFVAAGTLSGVSGGGLTWSIDKQIKNGSVSNALVSAQAPSGLAASTVITATLSASSVSLGISAISFTGVATSAPVDITASATSTSTSWTGGTVATLNANDVVVGSCMGDDGSDTTSAPNGTWTEPLTAGDFNSAGNGDSYTMVYQIVSATGNYTPGGTWGVTNTNAGVAVAYMQASAAAAATSPPVRRGTLGM